MKIFFTDTLTSEQKTKVYRLWNNEYPAQLRMESIADLDQYLSALVDASHILYTGSDSEILGWAFKFFRDEEKWFAVILDSSIHKKGIGSVLLHHLKENEDELNGWVIDHDNYKKSNLETYQSPIQFYIKNGFRLLENTCAESAKLSAVKILWTLA